MCVGVYVCRCLCVYVFRLNAMIADRRLSDHLLLCIFAKRAPLRAHCLCTPLHFYTYTLIPLYPYTFIPLYLYTYLPIYLYPYTLIPLYLYTLIPLFPHPLQLFQLLPKPGRKYWKAAPRTRVDIHVIKMKGGGHAFPLPLVGRP